MRGGRSIGAVTGTGSVPTTARQQRGEANAASSARPDSDRGAELMFGTEVDIAAQPACRHCHSDWSHRCSGGNGRPKIGIGRHLEFRRCAVERNRGRILESGVHPIFETG